MGYLQNGLKCVTSKYSGREFQGPSECKILFIQIRNDTIIYIDFIKKVQNCVLEIQKSVASTDLLDLSVGAALHPLRFVNDALDSVAATHSVTRISGGSVA